MPVFRYVDQTEATQKHWKLHSTVRHAIARFQHSKWNSEGAGLEDADGAHLLIWRQSPKEMIKLATRGKVTAKVHFWRSEDLSFEMVPESGCHNIDFHSVLGRTELVIQLMSTMPIAVHSSAVFLDQSIVLWNEGVMPSQWHFNYCS
eukprot:670249-Amphidinium_carterae.1